MQRGMRRRHLPLQQLSTRGNVDHFDVLTRNLQQLL